MTSCERVHAVGQCFVGFSKCSEDFYHFVRATRNIVVWLIWILDGQTPRFLGSSIDTPFSLYFVSIKKP